MFIDEIRDLGKWVSVIILIFFYLYGWSCVITDISKEKRKSGGKKGKIKIFSALWLLFHFAFFVLFLAWSWIGGDN